MAKIRNCINCGDKFFSVNETCFLCLHGISEFEMFLYNHRWKNKLKLQINYENKYRVKLIKQLLKDGYKLKYWKLKWIGSGLKAIDIKGL